MFNVSFNLGCRKCLKAEYIRTSYLITDAEASDYLERPEFEVMKKVEGWRAEDNRTCPFCGSPFVEVTNIEAGDTPIYDFDKLSTRCEATGEEMYMLNMDKNNDEIDMDEGGSPYPETEFLQAGFNTLLDYLNTLDQKQFVEHAVGNFFVCWTGNYDYDLDMCKIQIERFRCHGFSVKELIDGLRYVMNENDLEANF